MRTWLIFGLILPALAGCATAEQERAKAVTMSSFALCHKLSKGIFTAGSKREIYAMELHRRGESCGQYGTVVQTRPADPK